MAPTALVAGATGAAARRLVELLLARGWSVLAVTRRPPAPAERLGHVAADLSDASRAALAACGAVTHVFYAGRAAHGEGGVESVADNVAMLRNLLDGVLPVARGLEHVHLVQGTKYYGLHLGRFPTPAREDDPRHMPPNFYYDQQDLLVERRQGRRWTWSASRPPVICDFAPDRARNLVPLIGAYAAIAAELGVPLDFPGRPGCWEALTELVDAGHLARAMAFLATDPRGADRAFNVTNGDLLRWKRVWPRIAAACGVPPGEVRTLTLADWMKDKDAVWQRVVARHGLRPSRLSDIANWAFGDFVWRQDHDVVSSTTRLRLAGFAEVVDSEAMLLDQLARYRAAKILP
ncbi:MAG: SDR family oxidoreductase [Alphaproteobacteria bacterium]|nr:SDR family oxidoreductase [Alphaproteobacteria bacterium]